MSLREILARNMRRVRAERGISQEELAHRAKLNRNYVGMIEREEHAATVDTIDQLASALGVSPMDLLDPDAATR
ncbi:Xre family transcriptional regulator [Acidiphilium multivorum AIU301]|jgi:transcriptional regulator with XRE-family HTH domain|uniref:Xre family transcriptional regulator n=2 Tax=Acidocellaceae TaxID=3385905 RepID=F0J363_ACIMA|nr:Xre family transcriptional regulator [Acidiphilium multivorum AIU301]GAN73889.1 transcriptional regulator XRE [Acidiphilium multivorum AIU301]